MHTEAQVTDLVKKILENMQLPTAAATPTPTPMPTQSSTSCVGLYPTIDAAVDVAVIAQRQLLELSMAKREEILTNIRKRVAEANERISKLAVEETHLGRIEDKIRENILCIEKTPGTEDIRPTALSGDDGLMLLEYAPVGVIGAMTPITNATGTFVHNAISMIAAGNAVVFNCHPSAKATSREMIKLLHEAIVEAGGPAGLVGMQEDPNLDTARDLMQHPKINMLVATGGKGVVNAVLSSGKKAIGAGAGNPPVLVDETANIRRAANCITSGASVNNNIFCICEKEVIAVQEIEDILIKFMQETGKVYLLSPAEAQAVTSLVVKDNHINGDYIGRNVQVILKDAGIIVDEACRLAIFRAPKDHPLVWIEQMMPILPIVSVKNIKEGIAFGVEVEKGNRHTAIMHSTNIDNLTAFARAVQTTIFVKNAPCYAGIGLGGEGHTSFTIAGPTGEGLTSARTFTRQRRCTLAEAFRII